MVKTKSIFAAAILGLLVLAVSCTKNGTEKNSLIPVIEGTYTGTLSDSNGLKHEGTADVSAVNDSVLQIHCYDTDGFDTTFVMEFYADNDSVMLCNTGEDFVNRYGYEMTGAHHMWQAMSEHMSGGMSMDSNDWEQHLRNQHQPGDAHYGGFDMRDSTFTYRFVPNNGSGLSQTFSGKKTK